MSTKMVSIVYHLQPKSFTNMKLIITLFALILATGTFAQKAKSTGVSCKYHHIRYPENVELSAKLWALSYTEQTACRGAIKYQQNHTPVVATNPRSRVYMNLIGTKPKFYGQATDRISNLDAKQTPYMHYEIETRDISILTQQTKNKRPGAEVAQFNLVLEVRVPTFLKVTRKGNMNQVMLDTNNMSNETYWFSFPQNAALGTAPDIKPNGYPTEAELLAAWRKYGGKAEMQWREKIINEFLRPVCFNFTDEYIMFEEWDVVKIYSDKNKKGGYDHIVDAAQLFKNTLTEIDDDYKAGKRDKFYTEEYQTRLNSCKATWKEFLTQYDFNVLEDEGEVKAEYKQKMLINYIHSLIFTKDYAEADKLIDNYLTQEVRGVTKADLQSLKRLNNQFRKEYEANAARMGWN